MKKTDGAKSPKPTIKRDEALREKTPLCCLVNPKYLCKSCDSKLCVECNDKYDTSSRGDEVKLHFTAHLKEKCLKINPDKIFATCISCEQFADN